VAKIEKTDISKIVMDKPRPVLDGGGGSTAIPFWMLLIVSIIISIFFIK
jgi:hypothetical protein